MVSLVDGNACNFYNARRLGYDFSALRDARARARKSSRTRRSLRRVSRAPEGGTREGESEISREITRRENFAGAPFRRLEITSSLKR